MKNCDTCGNEFKPSTSKQLRCTDPDCRKKYWREKSARLYRAKHEAGWKPKPCATCGVIFDPGPMRQAKIPKKCDTCKQQPKRKDPVRKDCYTCGSSFLATPNHSYCRDICVLVGKKIKERIRHQRRRELDQCRIHGTPGFCNVCHAKEFKKAAARKRGYTGDQVTALELAEKQKFKCSLCDGRLDPSLSPRHMMSITIDHVVPRSHGGTDYPSNLNAAHRICNIRKGNRTLIPEQLRLVS